MDPIQSRLFQGDKNPMKHPVVLQRLFAVCPLSELRRARLVSRQWHKASLKPWRERVLIRIKPFKVAGTPVTYKVGNNNHYTKKTGLERSYSSRSSDVAKIHDPDKVFFSSSGEDSNSSDQDKVQINKKEDANAADNNKVPQKDEEDANSSDDDDDDDEVGSSDEEYPDSFNEFKSYVTDRYGQASNPFQKFQIKWHNSSKPLRKLVDICGPTMTYLNIKYTNLNERDQLRYILLSSKLPNLKTLLLRLHWNTHCNEVEAQLRRTRREFQIMEKPTLKSLQLTINFSCLGSSATKEMQEMLIDADLGLPFTWDEMLTYFPNLERLAIWITPQLGISLTPILKEMLETIKMFRRDGEAGKLDSVSLRDFTESNRPRWFRTEESAADQQVILQKLRQTGMKLKFLRLKFAKPPPEKVAQCIQAYKGLLKSTSESLQTLNVREVSTDRAPDGILPWPTPFPNLNSLTIRVDQCGQLEFLPLARKLRSLQVVSTEPYERIYDDDMDVVNGRQDALSNSYTAYADNEEKVKKWEVTWKSVREDTWIISGCPTLKELVYHKEVSLPELECLTKWFPNVESVTIPLDDGTFQIVCRNWRALRQLTILPHRQGGLSDRGITGCGGGTPSIKDLTELRVVRMKLPETAMDPKLTHVCLTEGFFHLRHLTHLEIIANLDDAAVSEVCQRYQTCVIFRRTEIPVPPRPPQPARKSMPCATRLTDYYKTYEKITNIWNA